MQPSKKMFPYNQNFSQVSSYIWTRVKIIDRKLIFNFLLFEKFPLY